MSHPGHDEIVKISGILEEAGRWIETCLDVSIGCQDESCPVYATRRERIDANRRQYSSRKLKQVDEETTG